MEELSVESCEGGFPSCEGGSFLHEKGNLIWRQVVALKLRLYLSQASANCFQLSINPRQPPLHLTKLLHCCVHHVCDCFHLSNFWSESRLMNTSVDTSLWPSLYDHLSHWIPRCEYLSMNTSLMNTSLWIPLYERISMFASLPTPYDHLHEYFLSMWIPLYENLSMNAFLGTHF